MRLYLNEKEYIETDKGMDCSIPLSASETNPKAWYVASPRIEPVRANGWVGAVNEGGSVNFRDISFNPHGHTTHTECLGHITEEVFSIHERLTTAFFRATVLTVFPEVIPNEDGLIDRVVTKNAFNNLRNTTEALLVRTLPNEEAKKSIDYSDTNPCYFDIQVVEELNRLEVIHFLVDTPSVDREKDGGKLAFHHAFWSVPEQPNHERTITELVFIPSEIEDGDYILNLQTANFINDATPSRPVLFKINSIE